MEQELNFNTTTTDETSRLFGRWFKTALLAIAGVVTAANPIIGAALVWAIEYADEHYGSMNRGVFDINDPRGSYEPTLSERSILKPQTDIIGEIVADISLMVTSFLNQPNVLLKYDLANKINYRGDFLLWYYKNNELEGLSQQAIDSRAYLIEKSLAPIYDKVYAEMFALGYTQTEATYVYPVWSEIVDLYPKSIKPFSYEVKYPSWRFTNEIKTDIPTSPNTPGESEVIIMPTTPAEIEDLPTTTEVPTNTTTCVVPEKKFYQKWWFWFGVGALTKKVLDK